MPRLTHLWHKPRFRPCIGSDQGIDSIAERITRALEQDAEEHNQIAGSTPAPGIS